MKSLLIPNIPCLCNRIVEARLLRYYCWFNPAQQLAYINFILAIIGAVLRIKGFQSFCRGTGGRIRISAALKRTEPSVSAALLRPEAALRVSLTPVLHPHHPLPSARPLGRPSGPVSLEGYLVGGLCRTDARLSQVLLRGVKAVQPVRSRSPGAATSPRRPRWPAGDAPLSSDPSSWRREENGNERFLRLLSK